MATFASSKPAANRLIVGLLAVICSLLASRLVFSLNFPIVLASIVFFVVTSVSFVRGTYGLYIVIFAMLFSPEISSGVDTGRTGGEGGSGIVLRIEDVVMMAVALGWILRSAYTGRRFGILHTKVNTAIWIYMGASVTTTLLGYLRGSVGSLSAGIFNNLKYFEYFLLFFMVLAHVRKKVTLVHMLTCMFVVFFLATAYGYTQIGSGRVCAPFDTEPNTFGGYLVLMICMAGGIALTDKRTKIRAPLIFLMLFAFPPMLFTLSRASYLALLVAIVAFLAISSHRVLIGAILLALIAAMFLGMPMLPDKVQERITGTFEREREYHVQIGSVNLDASASARIISYQQAMEKWILSPVVGYGVTGTHFIDGQYPRLLVETGVIGFVPFLIIFWQLFRRLRVIYRDANDRFLKGAAMGLLCGLFAMHGHALSANSFIIIRIAEPFWLLAGLTLIIPVIEGKKEIDESGHLVKAETTT